MRTKGIERILAKVLTILLIVIILATLSYHFFEGLDLFDAFYMTVITITTTGYREVGEMGVAGRIISMFLMFFGVGLFFYAVNTIVPLIVEREAEKWRKILKEIEDHYIICGYGHMGREIAKELPKDKIVIIDSDQTKVALAREHGFLAVQGDSSEEEVLKRVGVERARALIACAATDSINAFTIMMAKDLNPKLYTIAILKTPEGEAKIKKAGANLLLSPYKDVARKIWMAVRKPTVADFIEIMSKKGKSIMIEKIALLSDKFDGSTLKDLDLRRKTGCIVVIIDRDGDLIFPDPEIVLKKGDVLYVMGYDEQLRKAERLIMKSK